MTFDLDALEVEDESAPPWEFTYKGETYTLPLMGSMPWQQQMALQTMADADGLKMLLGVEQYERFCANTAQMSAGRLRELFKAWHAHQGVGPGE